MMVSKEARIKGMDESLRILAIAEQRDTCVPRNTGVTDNEKPSPLSVVVRYETYSNEPKTVLVSIRFPKAQSAIKL